MRHLAEIVLLHLVAIGFLITAFSIAITELIQVLTIQTFDLSIWLVFPFVIIASIFYQAGIWIAKKDREDEKDEEVDKA